MHIVAMALRGVEGDSEQKGGPSQKCAETHRAREIYNLGNALRSEGEIIRNQAW